MRVSSSTKNLRMTAKENSARIAREEAYASEIPGLTYIKPVENNTKDQCSINIISKDDNNGLRLKQAPEISANSTYQISNAETSPQQLITEVETIENGIDSTPGTSKPRINYHDDPYAYQCNLSQEKLQNLADDDQEEMDDDSLKAFLNIVRIESRKPVIVVSSHYRNRVPRLGLTKSLYDGKLEDFETAIIPVHMPSTEAAHWVLGIYRRNKSIFYYDSLGLTYKTVESNGETTVELAADWISETLKSAVRDITRDTKLDPKIKAVPLDGPQFEHYCPKHRINPQMDTVNCGFHIALIAEAFLMNNGEVFLENFDIATERTRILNILSGLREDNYRYTPRNASKDVDIDLEMQQSNSTMSASEKLSDSCKNETLALESVTKSVTNDHKMTPVEVSEKMNQHVQNAETVTVENDRPNVSNKRLNPSSATNRDESPSNPDQEIEVNTLSMENAQLPILSKETEIPEMPHPEANAQPKTNIQRVNLSRDEVEEDANDMEKEEPTAKVRVSSSTRILSKEENDRIAREEAYASEIPGLTYSNTKNQCDGFLVETKRFRVSRMRFY
ncbi:hypothetical protein Ddc_18934 [Ditylenchus destructor]|nr:hypothetical protein Ddc_18934 [Ditylenchus destructor]